MSRPRPLVLIAALLSLAIIVVLSLPIPLTPYVRNRITDALGERFEAKVELARLRVDSTHRVRRFITPVLFVGNNEYEMSAFSTGRRRLDRGRLALYVARTTTRWGTARLALHALVGRLDRSTELESLYLSTIEIASSEPRLRVALDGEVTRMTAPLHYRIRPRALQVVVSAASP